VKARLLLAVLCLLWPISAAAQVTGEFYMEKTTFARGEPLFLYFKLVNHGPAAVTILTGADPEQPFCSGNVITVSIDPLSSALCPRGDSCNSNGPPLSLKQLPSGQTETSRFLLNFRHEINAPSEYWVEAKHLRSRGPIADAYAHAKLYFRVDGNAPALAASKYQPWIDQLQSADRDQRREAARTLASLAPLSLEETLLGFANNPEFRSYAPLAFHRLNTLRSMQAMAYLMTYPETSAEVASYLAETNNQKYYPLLLDAAKRNARNSAYPAYAAELGGDKMLPVLVDLANSPDSFTHLNAVMAMGSTGSRTSIPLLLEQLKSPEPDTSERASYGLQLLTHRTAIQYRQGRNLQPEYIKWSQWWEREGATAPIYRATECGELVPLP
jgi:hypothetical protein